MTKRKLCIDDYYELAKFHVLQETDTIIDLTTIKNVADSDYLEEYIIGEACGWMWYTIHIFEPQIATEYLMKGYLLGDNYCTAKYIKSRDHLVAACCDDHPLALYDMGLFILQEKYITGACYFLSLACKMNSKAAKETLNMLTF